MLDKVLVKIALLSVSDKNGIVELAQGLAELGVELISTGGTAKALAAAGLTVTPVEKVTGSPEMLGGRVKTLHPAVHGGVLARRDNPDDMKRLAELGIAPIDMVVVNLYPFAQAIAKEGITFEKALEEIDIGGPTLLRAAAKNFPSVAALCDPADYAEALRRLRESGGAIDLEFRAALAAKVFAHTAAYDAMISGYFSDLAVEEGEPVHKERPFPGRRYISLIKKEDLRYGENPHQRAALYKEEGAKGESLVDAEQIQGKELSFNNLTDLEGAWQLASEFSGRPFCAIIKHANPCGAALGGSAGEAFETALACDPVSAFGGIIALNTEVDGGAAAAMKELFFECLIAPSYTGEALEILRKKKNVRVMRSPLRRSPAGWDIRRISGGLLLQDYDWGLTPREEWKTVTKREPTAEETAALEFAWRICKHVKSNAIVFAAASRILGVGAGQMSRVDSAKIAAARFDPATIREPIAMASDAFFPFRDGLDVGAQAGATAVIQPGGSKRDGEVIVAADEQGLAMVFTGRRHFRH
jgi:phosphoribosylaminoimidazolecarboxamide formyltransferase/IMP cyclohydrolase